ncbi:hypothetical protein BGX27_004927 [Mortierella sp. AM989]|nr:hypothetical protein BGX27_004927 [Mortierella sp. AM989]
MPSTPVRPLSNHLVINTHNLSQAHNRGSPRSANANSAMTLKDPHRPPAEKRHSYGPSSLGPGTGGPNGNVVNSSNLFSGHGHLGHGHSRTRQSLILTFLRIVAAAPGLFGLMYSISVSWDNNFFEQLQQQSQYRESSYQTANNEAPLTRSDFWVASMWASASITENGSSLIIFVQRNYLI